LPEPFLVIATQNPIEYHGTYPLPEAQLDRFAMLIEMGYPDEDQEISVVLDQRDSHPLEDLKPVAGPADVMDLQQQVRRIDVEPTVVRYVIEIVRATRQDPRLRLGASPRAALILYRTCQALAFVRGRAFVIPDDVKELTSAVLAHRVVLNSKAGYAGVTKRVVVNEVLATVKAPV
jgi:MoxR-like ATPase